MNLRWLVFDYVDPALEIDLSERRRIRRVAWERMLHPSAAADPHRVVPLWARIIAPLLPPFGMSVAMVLFFIKPAKSWWDFAWVIALQMGVTWLMCAIVARWTWRPAVWGALRDAGHHVCIRCGYWLRGLRDDVRACPECGALREPMTREPPL